MFPSYIAVLGAVAFQGAVASAAGHVDNAQFRARGGTSSGFSRDHRASPYCTLWHYNDGTMSCEDFVRDFHIPMADFVRWNPSVGHGCRNFDLSRAYCMAAKGEPAAVRFMSTTSGGSTRHPTNRNAARAVGPPANASPTVAADVEIVGRAAMEASPTKPSNGVPTPSRVQPGMVANCGKFLLVKQGNSCANIAAKAGISISDLVKWNPKVGKDCAHLWANTYACVGVLPAFSLQTRYHNDCTGMVNNNVSVTGSTCINTDCSVASLDIAAEGYCPDGQVQISYWEKPGCGGKWFGYGYAGKGECRAVWTQGWKFKSLHFRCAKEQDDCVSKQTCAYEPEPDSSLC